MDKLILAITFVLIFLIIVVRRMNLKEKKSKKTFLKKEDNLKS